MENMHYFLNFEKKGISQPPPPQKSKVLYLIHMHITNEKEWKKNNIKYFINSFWIFTILCFPAFNIQNIYVLLWPCKWKNISREC
jgi:hypothetical protein